MLQHRHRSVRRRGLAPADGDDRPVGTPQAERSVHATWCTPRRASCSTPTCTPRPVARSRGGRASRTPSPGRQARPRSTAGVQPQRRLAGPRPRRGHDHHQHGAPFPGPRHQPVRVAGAQAGRDVRHDQAHPVQQRGNHGGPGPARHVADDREAGQLDPALTRRESAQRSGEVHRRRPLAGRGRRGGEAQCQGRGARAGRPRDRGHRPALERPAGYQRAERSGNREDALARQHQRRAPEGHVLQVGTGGRVASGQDGDDRGGRERDHPPTVPNVCSFRKGRARRSRR